MLKKLRETCNSCLVMSFVGDAFCAWKAEKRMRGNYRGKVLPLQIEMASMLDTSWLILMRGSRRRSLKSRTILKKSAVKAELALDASWCAEREWVRLVRLRLVPSDSATDESS